MPEQRPNQPSISIPGDTVNRATAALPDAERSAIRWLHSHALEQGWGTPEIAAKLRKKNGSPYDPNTIYQIFTGSHTAGKKQIAAEIEKLRATVTARAGTDALHYIETSLTKRIWKVCDNCLIYQRIAFIFGDSQIGKTTALAEYQRTHNHGSTILVRMPAAGKMGDFLRALAAQLRISHRLSTSELKTRIKAAFDDRMILIVDEAHQGMRYRSGRSYSTEPYEFLREIHDERRCGLVIAATNVFREEIETGRQAGVLEQLSRRRLVALQLPNTPTKADLDTFATAYGLPPATGEAAELQSHTIKDQALGVWLMLLRMTAGRCHRTGKTMTWEDVTHSNDMLRKLEG